MLTRSPQIDVRRNKGELARWLDRPVRGNGQEHKSSSVGGNVSELLDVSDELHVSLSELYANQTRWLFASVRDRLELLDRCVESVAASASNWVDVACEIKQIPTNSPCRAEEILSGPIIALRYLRLMQRNLRAIETGNENGLPGRLTRSTDGRWQVPVLPMTRDLFDPVCFVNFKANVWLRQGLMEEDAIAATRPIVNHIPATSLILGAGNVTGIVAADLLGKLFQDQHTALVKLHPLTAALQPVFERAFEPLIDVGCLRMISGGAELGARAVHHPLVDDVHVTGSAVAHDAIVWGEPGADRDERRRENEPLLDKPITSELGNVSPWIIVPGRYSEMQLQSQAENVAASIVNNAGFNCVSTRVLVTWKHWPQREDFLSRLQAILSQLPRRVAYYPGAVERFERFTGCQLAGMAWSMTSAGDEFDEHGVEQSHRPAGSRRSEQPRLPWTLFRDVDADDSPLFCNEESFVPVCAEMPLDAADEFDFVGRATDFANERLWGTLCATLTVPDHFRHSTRGRSELIAALSRLRYGTICINQWPGVAFALLSIPWGGHPSSTLLNPQSGIGWTHNTFGLRSIEKTVLEGPLTVVPRPLWSPLHRHAEPIAWHLFDLYHKPSLRHVADLTYSAFASIF